MKSDRWKQIETLFHQALEKPPGERSAFLDAACAGDSKLRAEVQTLLIRDDLGDGFLDAPSKVVPGTRLGQFYVLSALGKGGMGEVWRAKDTTLGREVAIKTLPEAFARDPDRLSRFEREAKLLASLNHPNIAVIHGLEESEGTRFLVLELIEGRTLREMLESGPVDLESALKIGVQIAEALEAAHTKGVIHRDLKPANIKVSDDGKVKVLDFGLAKAMAGDKAGLNDSNSPTLSTAGTHAGVILGTPAYMSPEQAKGRPVDRRADIFALGLLLYEMMAGCPAFQGESLAEVLSRVLEHEPDWTRLPSNAPPSVRRLIRLCLEKDPAKRRQWAGDVRVDLEQAMSETEDSSTEVVNVRSLPARLAWIGSAIVLMVLLAIPAVTHLRETLPLEMRLEVTTPPTEYPLQFATSPDGQYVAFVAQPSSDTAHRLYLRRLDDETGGEAIPGTEGARYPCWSPDSRTLGFFATGQLLLIDVAGGSARPLAIAPNPLGCTWGEGGILFTPESTSPLLLIAPDSGTEPVAATELDRPRQQNHRFPSFLPDAVHFIFYVTGDPEVSGIYLGSLDDETPKRLTPIESAGVFLAPNRVVFAEGGMLMARQLDLARGELTGEPETLAPSVGSESNGWVGFSAAASAMGILSYRAVSGNPQMRLTWLDRQGNELGDMEGFNGPELSPDDRYMAAERVYDDNREVVVLDLLRGGETRLTNNPDTDGYPLWCPDGQQLVFESNRNGTFGLWIGSPTRPNEERVLLDTPAHEIPLDCSKDGRYVLYSRRNEAFVSADLLALPMPGENPASIEVAADPRFEEGFGAFSPDGRWIVYETDQSSRPEIRVIRFPELDLQYPVSTNGGFAPRWTTEGEINFVGLDGAMMSVAVSTTNSTFEAELPERLFPTELGRDGHFNPFNHAYDVSSDGRFLVMTFRELEDVLLPITLVTNWRP